MNPMKKGQVLLFDGALGTYLAQKYGVSIGGCERENISHPERIAGIHAEYIEAGARAIKTNTFAANTVALGTELCEVLDIVRAGCEIAQGAAAGKAEVFASIGPIYSENAEAEYCKIIDVFLAMGIKNFLFETFSVCEPLLFAAEYIKDSAADSFIICECTVKPDRYTNAGVFAQDIINELQASPFVDAYGFNCTCGPLHMANLARELEFFDKPVSMMPNAGYPTIVDGRTVFDSTPEYFARQVMDIRHTGVGILGGCCGTTPEHISAVALALAADSREYAYTAKPRESGGAQQKREVKKGFIAVELDAPANADTAYFTISAQQIAEAGADVITIADCPIGRARADSSMLASMLKRQYGIEAMPHLTCRDRNLNASKALLLGLNMQGVERVLVVTGDPIPAQERDVIKSVYQFNSVRYASFIQRLNADVFMERPFEVMGALNVNAPNFDAELAKAEKKIAAGMSCLLTQPVMDEASLQNLRLAKERLDVAILAGIMPVVSYNNARFINNEVAGISVPDSLIERYRVADKADYANIAVDFALERAKAASEISDGYYIITSLRRADIVCEIVKEIRKW